MRRIGLLAAIFAIGTSGSASAATIEVDSATDDGTGCTLREAVASADGNADSGGCTGAGTYGDDTVTFDSGVTGTIPLATELAINPTTAGTLSIQGPGSGALALSGQDAHRVLLVTANASSAANAVTISGLEIRDGLIAAPDVNGDAYGAGVFNAGRLDLDRVEVSDNSVTAEVTSGPFAFVGAGGGGISNQGALAVSRSTISGNTVTASVINGEFAIASAAGGGIRSTSMDMSIVASTISGNSAAATAIGNSSDTSLPAAGGGGVAVSASNFPAAGVLEGTTVVGNTLAAFDFESPSPGQGGGVALLVQSTSASLAINHSTVATNSTNLPAGAANISEQGGALTVRSTVIAEPQVGTNCGIPIRTAGHNLADDNSCGLGGTGDVQGTPAGLQASLTDNGGPTLTRRPVPGSPLIDAGIAAGATLDQRDFPRTVEYDTADGPGGDGTDIGAVEIQGAAPTATNPVSPSTDTSPEATGVAEPGSTVQLYSDNACTSAQGSPATATAFASPGISAGPFAANSAPSFHARATYGTATSACSPSGVAYVIPPTAPALNATAPASPANDNSPRLQGVANPSTTVTIYTASNCTGPVAGTGSDADLAGAGIAVTVSDNSTTTYYARASSANGTSPCSAGISYTESTPPPDPGPGTNPDATPPPPVTPKCKKGQKLKKGKCVKRKRKRR